MDLPTLDGFAGFAALVNGLILWPLYYMLKKDHGQRIGRLEAERLAAVKKPKPARTKRRRGSI